MQATCEFLYVIILIMFQCLGGYELGSAAFQQ